MTATEAIRRSAETGTTVHIEHSHARAFADGADVSIFRSAPITRLP
jgi:hypothetical protein